MDLEKELQVLEKLIQQVKSGNSSKNLLDSTERLRKEVIKRGKQELRLMIAETKRVKEKQKGQLQEKIRMLEQTDPLTDQVKARIDKLKGKLKQADDLDNVLKKREIEMLREFKKCGITADELGIKRRRNNKSSIETTKKVDTQNQASSKESLKHIEENKPEDASIQELIKEPSEHVENEFEEDITAKEEASAKKREDEVRLKVINNIIENDIERKMQEIEQIERQLKELGNGKKNKNIIIRAWDRVKEALGFNKSNKALASGSDIVTNKQSWKDTMEVPVEPLSIDALEEKAKKQLENQIGIGSIAKIDDTVECYDIQKDISMGKVDVKDKEFKIDFIALFDKEGNMEHCLNSGNIGKILTQKENLESVIKVHLLPIEDEEENDEIKYEQRQEDDEGMWVLWKDVKGKFVDYMLKQKEVELGNI